MYFVRRTFVVFALAVSVLFQAVAQDAQTFALAFKPGFAYELTLTSLNMSEFSEGTMAMESVEVYALKVDEAKPDGAAKVTATLKKATMRGRAPWFDCETDEAVAMLSSAGNSTHNKSFTFTLSADGQIGEMAGAESIREGIDASFKKSIGEPVNEELVSVSMLFAGWLKPNVIQYQLLAAFHGHRTEPTKLGEGWTIEDQTHEYVKADLKRTFLFDSIAQSQWRLKVSGGGSGDAGHDITCKEVCEGEIKLNRETNWPEEIKITVNMDQTYKDNGEPREAKAVNEFTVIGKKL